MKTIDYYNQYAEEFSQATLHLDMETLYHPFLADLLDIARILDVGCGSGRDTLAFKNKGYQVDAIDYSEKLVKKSTRLIELRQCYSSLGLLRRNSLVWLRSYRCSSYCKRHASTLSEKHQWSKFWVFISA